MQKNELSSQAVQAGEAFARLYDIIVQLRGPQGCPWDKAQTLETLHPHLVEECYELMEGINNQDDANICEELGDVYLVNTMIAHVMEEKTPQQHVADVLQALCEKLIRRHPHVFGENKAMTPEEGHASWLRAKMEEKKSEYESPGYLHRQGRGLPPLEQATKIQQKMIKAGFAWPNAQAALDKVHEELDELKTEISAENLDKVKEELGDVLFSLVGLAQNLGIDASEAVYYTSKKVVDRVHKIESALKEKGLALSKENRDLMEELWEKVKKSKL